MNEPTSTLTLTKSSDLSVEVLMTREDGEPEDLSGVVSAELELRATSLDGADVLASWSSSATTADSDGMVFTIAAGDLDSVPPGRYFGFVRVELPSGTTHLREPFVVQIVSA